MQILDAVNVSRKIKEWFQREIEEQNPKQKLQGKKKIAQSLPKMTFKIEDIQLKDES